jgi:hypothetical protein
VLCFGENIPSINTLDFVTCIPISTTSSCLERYQKDKKKLENAVSLPSSTSNIAPTVLKNLLEVHLINTFLLVNFFLRSVIYWFLRSAFQCAIQIITHIIMWAGVDPGRPQIPIAAQVYKPPFPPFHFLQRFQLAPPSSKSKNGN